MGKEVNLSILLKKGRLYEFLLYNTYYGFFGIISAGVILFSSILLITGIGEKGVIQKILLAFFILIFLAIIPLAIYLDAVKQLKLSPIYNKPLLYRISNEGINVNHGDHLLSNNWGEVNKAVELHNSIILYSYNFGAFILPKLDIGEDYDLLKAIIVKNMSKRKCKFKW
jgi:hypothetical protein